jgi:hypothetical protein
MGGICVMFTENGMCDSHFVTGTGPAMTADCGEAAAIGDFHSIPIPSATH